MRGAARALIGVVAGMLLHASAPTASSAQALRSGFWLEGSTGTGTVRNTCAGCQHVTVAYGTASHIRVGGSLNQRVLVGVELFALHSSELRLVPGSTPVDARNGSLAPIVIWYVGHSGFFLKAGAGLARGTFSVQSASRGTVTAKRTGSGLTFGIGYDIALMRWVGLTANFGTYVTAIGDINVDDTFVDDVIATVYEAGVGITWR